MTNARSIEIVVDEHGFAFETERTFRGLTISESSGGFNCVIRARERSGAPVYAMTVDSDPQVGINRLYEALSMGNGDVLWRHDAFAARKDGG